ncbi:uncharacterized membrane protein (UPF0127 family) [Stenotrophomonas sp. AN71]|uniref:DUF192 domain-containing protein n=1 Tax=Stenotrophomonas sp. AN71 TaxID=3156253 RepID=UPI003D240914
MIRGDQQLLSCVWHADRWYQRLQGLLLRAPLQAGQGLLITPCSSVHTLAMGYPLDLLFLDHGQRVVGWREAVRPWRGAWCRGAHSTLEMPVDSLQRIAPMQGEQFQWCPSPSVAPPSPRALQ